MNTESSGQRSLMKSYYKCFPDIINPESLSDVVDMHTLPSLPEYYIAYGIRSARIDKIEHIKDESVYSTFEYFYVNHILIKIDWFKNQDELSDKCEITFAEGFRLTKCFYKSGALYTEEWYNIETSDYNFGRYDTSGKLEYSEYGSYSPQKDQ